ncbi:toxic anion resistance protein [Escherichia coli]
MNGTEDSGIPTVAELKEEIIPGLLLDAEAVGHYGDSAVSSGAMDRYSSLMETAAVTGLSETISSIVSALTQADPRTIAKNPSWFTRFTGTHIEKRVRYQQARDTVEVLLVEGNKHLGRVNETLAVLDELQQIYHVEIARLQVYIQAGRDYLSVESVGETQDHGDFGFDRPRERFARKVANLATLLASNELAVMQMKMTRAQCLDLVDRFIETTKVLVPVWRQHTLSLLTIKNIDPTVIAKASQAHQALLSSLHTNLEGMDK